MRAWPTKALSHAKFLAQHSAGQIHLIHVIPAFSPVLTRGFISDARKMEDHLLNTAKEKLSELVRKMGLRKTPAIFMCAVAMFAIK
ncbi:Universal stress protein G [Klebsiella pneumoniae]|uniref:Universal stress protein G n=1 Tax=Klebsiella pneumoniae TaxID=573 RepID=A0A2X1QNW0_KLEPN|nr:Universal stress protein G [Klebsiella pneumoniae]